MDGFHGMPSPYLESPVAFDNMTSAELMRPQAAMAYPEPGSYPG